MRSTMVPLAIPCIACLLWACGDDTATGGDTTDDGASDAAASDTGRPDTTPDESSGTDAATTSDGAADTIEDASADIAATDTTEDASADSATTDTFEDTVGDIATTDTLEDVAADAETEGDTPPDGVEDTLDDTSADADAHVDPPPVTEEVTLTSVACDDTELLCDVQRVAAGVIAGHPVLSQDLRHFAFSTTSALEAADTNSQADIYLLDREAGTYRRVSLAADGVTQGAGASANPRLSWDAGVVVFSSESPNLTPQAGDNGTNNDAFAYLGATSELVHLSAGLTTSTQFADTPFVSGDGRWVVYRTNGPGITGVTARQVVRYDLDAGTRDVVSLTPAGAPGNDESAFAKLSYGGRFVAFESFASDLVPDDTNGVADVFVRDLDSGVTTRVSVASDGAQGDLASRRPVLSADGRWVGFMSDATNLVPGDGNGKSDVYLVDRLAGTIVRASIRPDGTEPNGHCQPFDVSVTGRVVFYSEATSWLDGDPGAGRDMVVFDATTSALIVATSRADGTLGQGSSDVAHLSADGRWVVFNSPGSAGLVDTGSGTLYLRWLGP